MRKYDFVVTVNGAAGFIGSNLCRAFLNGPYDVKVLATDYYDSDLRRLEDLCGHENFTYEEYDAHQPIHSDFLAVDTFYHLVGRPDPRTYIDDPIGTLNLNLDSMRNVLERIVRWGSHRPRIVYTSTSEVYGKNMSVPFDEESSLLVYGPTQQPRWTYAMTKAVGEHYLRGYEREGVRHTIFRLFNVVGKDVDSLGTGRVLTKMIGSALEDGYIRVVEPGTQTRCFTWIDDAIALFTRPTYFKKFPIEGIHFRPESSQTINAGSDLEINMIKLAELVGEAVSQRTGVGYPVTVVPSREVYGEKPYDDMMRRVPNTERAQEWFGWKAVTPLEEIIQTVVSELVPETGAGDSQESPEAQELA